MTVRDILVHVDTTPACDARLQFAGHLARRFNAYLIGAYVHPPPSLAPEVIDYKERAVAAQSLFEALLEHYDLRGEWHIAVGPAAPLLARKASAADVVVVGQNDPDNPSELKAPEDVVLICGRPAIVLPFGGRFDPINGHVVVAWRNSREARRAVQDALPFMAISKGVTVVSVNPDPEEGDERAAGLLRHLRRHGYDAKSEVIRKKDVRPADAVLSRAAELAADLIVMGAYGHTRLRDMILGSTTQDMLRDMTMPVLMAH